MELYHLDWKKVERQGADTLLAIISPALDPTAQAEQAALAYARGDYVKVATLKGYGMNDVYPMTQNLDEGWTDNRGPRAQHELSSEAMVLAPCEQPPLWLLRSIASLAPPLARRVVDEVLHDVCPNCGGGFQPQFGQTWCSTSSTQLAQNVHS